MESGAPSVTILSRLLKRPSSVASLASQAISDLEQLAPLELGKVTTLNGWHFSKLFESYMYMSEVEAPAHTV